MNNAGLSRDELNFVIKNAKYGKRSIAELAQRMGLQPDEKIFHFTSRAGARVANELPSEEGEVDVKPGDVFVPGPKIFKAVGASVIAHEMAILRSSGLGGVSDPVKNRWGISIHLAGITLLNGRKSEAMIVLPDNYPNLSPIGFYLKKDAFAGYLDKQRLFADRTYHGAPDLSADGWEWFCGNAASWVPHRHNLLTYVGIVLRYLNEGGVAQ